MAFNIQEFISNGLIGGGARPSNFKVSIFTPFASSNESRTNFLISATEIPSSPVAQIPVYYFGRAIKLAGNREFPNWTVEVLNDEDFALKIMFENWSNRMNALISNRSSEDALDNGYKSSGIVAQLGQDGSTLREYNLQGIWPTQISPIRLSWQDGNAIETYTVEFSVDYWEPIGVGNSDDYSGSISPDGVSSTFVRQN
jgi:hypothetical protein